MSFEDYIESKIPGYRDFLSKQQIDELVKLYSEYIICSKSALKNIEQQFDNKAGIDFTNDFNKNQSRTMIAKKELDKKIMEIQNQLNIQQNDKKTMSW